MVLPWTRAAFVPPARERAILRRIAGRTERCASVCLAATLACGMERVATGDAAEDGTEPSTAGVEADLAVDLGGGEPTETPGPDCGAGPIELPRWELVELKDLVTEEVSVLGDLDGDGRSELLRGDVAPALALHVEVDGSWSATPLPPGNYREDDFAHADLNEDGVLDFATIGLAMETRHDLVVYESVAGSYEAQLLQVPLVLAGVVFADLDEDGTKDLVVKGAEGMNFSLLLYRRDPDSGTYSSVGAPIEVLHGRLRLVAADFDGDGREDLVAGDGILFAGGDEMLWLGISYGEWQSVDAVELTGDTALDLLVGQGGAWGHWATALYLPSEGAPPPSILLADDDRYHVSGDVDDNGIQDLQKGWELLLSCGDGVFSEPFPFLVDELEGLGASVDATRRDAALGDLDGEAGGELLVGVEDRHFLAFPRG